ncbi:MAG: hypothetical protein IJ762_02355 [Bacteroidaceae bacterium]|nr:hypothetical protein [Bacteroidaceae bacterium]
MKHLRLVTLMLVFAVSLPALAIPNFGAWTDGRLRYEVRGSISNCLSFYTFDKDTDGRARYFALTSFSERAYTVDSLKEDFFAMPFTMQPSDTARWGQTTLFLFDRCGRPYASLKRCESYSEPELLRRQDSLAIVSGTYQFAGNRQMVFTLNEERIPVLQPSAGMAEEPVTFCPDVVHNGRPLMHILTPKRRWLIEVTATGLNVYAALWSKSRGQYVRGTLQRRAKLLEGRTRPYGDYQWGFPFVDLVVRYYTPAVCRRLLREMEPWRGREDFELYCDVIKRLSVD